MQKFLMILWLVLTSSIAYGDRSDLILKGRENGGKVIIAPKNSSGAVSSTITIDPEAQTVSVANGQLLVNGVQANFAIGSIQQSILTEANFQAQMGSDWVAMKGQDISGSKLCTDYSICTLPDARNRFMRNSDGSDTNLRGLVNDTTAKNSLALTGNVGGGTASLTGNVGGGTASLTGNVGGGTASLTGNISGGSLSGSAAPNSHTHSVPGHYHGFSLSASEGTWSVSASNGSQSFGTNVAGQHNHAMAHSIGAGSSGPYVQRQYPINAALDSTSPSTEQSGNHSHSWSQTISVSGSATRLTNSPVGGSIGYQSGSNGDSTSGFNSGLNSGTAITFTAANNGTLGIDNTAANNGTLGIDNTAANNGTLGIDNTAANNGTLAIGTGDSETAPDHIIVNTFVKIN